MSRVSVPISIRRLRYKPRAHLTEVAAFEYLLRNLKRHVISEKYVLDKNVLVLDMLNSSKNMTKMSIETIFKQKVIKIGSCVRKPYVKYFRGRFGESEKYTRVYIRTENPVDIKLLDFNMDGDK